MSRAAKWIERCLWVVGFVAIGSCIAVWIYARHEQAAGDRELDRRIHVHEQAPPASPAAPVRPVRGDLVGRLEIPRLAMKSVIFEGTDEDVLQRGVGHLPGSPLPGEGNVVVAGHRDTFFRPLRNIRPRDVITVTTDQGTRRYTVESTAIVNPEETGVLEDTSGSTLTLITCYPFRYIGHAPQRFVVRGREAPEVVQAAAHTVAVLPVNEAAPRYKPAHRARFVPARRSVTRRSVAPRRGRLSFFRRLGFGRRQPVRASGKPYVQRRQQKDTY